MIDDGGGGRHFTADAILIATGSHPFRPPGIPFEDPDVHDSDSILEAEKVLVTSGRVGNTSGLGLETVGVQTDDHGRILVDEAFRTSVPSIHAAGDVIGSPALASTSMEQARVAICRAFGFAYKQAVSTLLPFAV